MLLALSKPSASIRMVQLSLSWDRSFPRLSQGLTLPSKPRIRTSLWPNSSRRRGRCEHFRLPRGLSAPPSVQCWAQKRTSDERRGRRAPGSAAGRAPDERPTSAKFCPILQNVPSSFLLSPSHLSPPQRGRTLRRSSPCHAQNHFLVLHKLHFGTHRPIKRDIQ